MFVRIEEDNEYRRAVFDRLLSSTTKSGWAHQHHLWPCVRRGAGERYMETHGGAPRASNAAALYFLRGHSAELLIADQNKERIVLIYKGVACRPDVITGEHRYPFIEIKSTNYSSATFWNFVKAGQVDMTKAFPMKNYFEQAARYAVALNVEECRLHVYFTHGDYGDRRTKCPECGNKLGDWEDDFYKVCSGCGYKSMKIDFRAYRLTFDRDYLDQIDGEYDTRGDEFRAAQKVATIAELRDLTTATPNYACMRCEVGKEMGCEYFGTEHD